MIEIVRFAVCATHSIAVTEPLSPALISVHRSHNTFNHAFQRRPGELRVLATALFPDRVLRRCPPAAVSDRDYDWGACPTGQGLAFVGRSLDNERGGGSDTGDPSLPLETPSVHRPPNGRDDAGLVVAPLCSVVPCPSLAAHRNKCPAAGVPEIHSHGCLL
jgi:hypothetical protein